MQIHTLKQIKNKIEKLKAKLSQVSFNNITENFGSKECAELETFVGDVYNYQYEKRLIILGMLYNFATWCASYTGKGKNK